MKQAQRKNFFREIRGSFNRWLSLLFIVALGVAFFSGIRSAEPDMRLSADQLYDGTNFMDIRVLGTLGVTEDDLNAIREIPGVNDTEGLISLEALANDGEQELVVQVSTLPQKIGLPILSDGRMPETTSECLLDVTLSGSYPLGSTISLYGDQTSADEEDTGEDTGTSTSADTELSLENTLTGTEFTVVGYFSSATYLSWDRGTASIGDGSLDGLLMLIPEAFSSDYYTEIYVTVEGAKGLTSMTQEYEDTVAGITDQIEAIADARCQIRYDSIVDEANQELADGRQELEDAREEADQELADARQQLVDAEEELEEGRRTLEENEQELADGREALEEGRRTLEENEQTLADSREQLEAGRKELEERDQQMADAWELYHQGEADLEQGRQALADLEPQEEQMQAALETIEDQEEELAQGWEEYYDELEAYETNQQTLEGLKTQLEQLAALLISQGIDPSQNEEYQTLAGTIAQMEPALTEAKETLDASYQTLTAGQEALDAAQETKQQLQDGLAQIAALREQIQTGEAQLAEQLPTLEEAQQQLDAGWEELETSEQALAEGEAQLAEARRTLEENEATIQDGEEQLEEGRQELDTAEQEIADGWEEYYDGEEEASQEIADAEQDLADAEDAIADIEFPEWYVLDRNSVQDYVEYDMDAQRIGAIGNVFPVIFFLVAALVALTTMTRMVEDDRTQIGTLKALGYSKGSIAQKYILYALSATLLGSLLGVIVGGTLLPWVILTAYGILYTTFTEYVIPLQLSPSLISTLLAILCTVGATLAACYKELAATPAQLMRPASPKEGKRVLLERVTILWKHLSFTSKSTVRNLFRYKKRFFMTVFGIGGCMGLLMVGFGLRDSIARIVDNQYATIWTYGATLTIADHTDLDTLEGSLTGYPEIHEALPVCQIAKDASKGNTTTEVYLFVPEQTDNLADFVHLRNRTSGETYTLSDQGVVITEKLARLLDLSVGDAISLLEDETSSVEATVLGIAENYLYHYIYMTPALYQQLYGEAPEYNTVLLSVDDLDETQENQLSTELMALDGITSVSFIHELQTTVDDMMRSLDLVIWVLIISAGLLAFVVLYNLNNINITERHRELATLKVLGFFDGEVAAYVYRENVLLTILGILAGILIGVGLHRYLIQTVELDYMMFGQTIQPPSYLYSILLTVVFSVIVNFFVFFKLRKIDMIESLKSVE